MIEAVISGIGFGLVLTFLTGPVFFALIKTSIDKGFQAGVALALGVVCSDMVFVGAILFGSQYFDVTAKDKIYAGVVGSIILFVIGIYYMFKKAQTSYNTTVPVPTRLHKAGYFFKGFLMCIFNPTILFHWTIVIGAASTVYHQGVHNRSAKIAVMFLTVLIVQFGLDTTKAFYADKLRDKISVKFIHRLNEVAGIALIIASLVLLDKLVTHFVFSAPSS
ncbi:threonine/homoserine/homoserine lactone efflux protein [Mucilaginibacter frigoritolerans]|jgi:threonine/homoserine/homoserine lactone efflux protein|uniref:Threonine/homoserine/homoserine lactone efflux protein n=1 Tax=Mucilaginibacter frigoritolerans TaxID=652788 RepID=A0A562UAN8_9SPHI|nr:LysE family transporter [Mucilaginibacter frigoritolerans]TWJ02517.1 threonine/homoserine/homoserine lactone efflux protein [Mucilaginibacter frigoritolerans]